MADGYSVQEMLKVVTMLYNAVKSNKSDLANEDVNERSFDVSNKVSVSMITNAYARAAHQSFLLAKLWQKYGESLHRRWFLAAYFKLKFAYLMK